jgi:hypothetical protein
MQSSPFLKDLQRPLELLRHAITGEPFFGDGDSLGMVN